MALKNPEQAKLLKQASKRGGRKYKNQPVQLGIFKFDSKAEAARFVFLQQLARAGSITYLHVKPVYVLTGGVKFIPDFEYRNPNKELVTEDVKGGPLTQAFRIKAKLFKAHTGRIVEIIRLKPDVVNTILATVEGIEHA